MCFPCRSPPCHGSSRPLGWTSLYCAYVGVTEWAVHQCSCGQCTKAEAAATLSLHIYSSGVRGPALHLGAALPCKQPSPLPPQLATQLPAWRPSLTELPPSSAALAAPPAPEMESARHTNSSWHQDSKKNARQQSTWSCRIECAGGARMREAVRS